MRHILTFLTAVMLIAGCSTKEGGVKDNGKTAILMVHFGTTHDDTRALTIDAINQKVKDSFPECDVFEAYTSRIIIKRLKERGIEKQTPSQVMERLIAEGYKKVYIQPTNIITGKENKTLGLEVDKVRDKFTDVRIGKALLYSLEDTREVVAILTERHRQSSADAHVLLVGHGTDDPGNALYSQTDYMFKSQGHDNFHVATIEGFPEFDDALAQLQKRKARKVTLVPFMFVAGDHAANDISQDWKKSLEGNGFQVDVKMEGLGQIPEIQDIFIRHLNAAIESGDDDFLRTKDSYLK
ncbi:MAG: sirohydrochlorin cobaltochelatase [Bacteroidales bacterium]|nr:sirohydrochlorin cobaltochelatase [Bacteroidales bacterium]